MLYTLLLIYFMFFGFGRSPGNHADYMYNLRPFHTIGSYLNFAYFTGKIRVINLFGNIGMFIPFGVLIPLSARFKFAGFLLCFELGLISLEVLQLVTKRGSFDIDDIILNTFGALIGYALYKRLATGRRNV
jgi:glycopeptide antibiotics resistance protein